MSGGSFNYLYSTIEYGAVGFMEDEEMDDLMSDIVKVLHDLEWWKSGDIGEEDYRDTVKKFKKKWFNPDGREDKLREDRLKEYMEDILNRAKKEMEVMVV